MFQQTSNQLKFVCDTYHTAAKPETTVHDYVPAVAHVKPLDIFRATLGQFTSNIFDKLLEYFQL